MIECLECKGIVEFDNKKQEYFEKNKFPHPPLFCNRCQSEKLLKIWSFSGLNRTVICSDCKKETLLHFIPVENTPLQCKQCYDISQQNKVSHETCI